VLRLAGSGGFDRETLNRLRSDAARVQDLSEKQVVSEVSGAGSASVDAASGSPTVAVLDYGLKHNIAHSLIRRGLHPVVLPWTATIDDLRRLDPAGVVLSNGPGDPATLPDVVRTVSDLLHEEYPVLGICLGHQLIGRAIGASTSRLRYGHHGGNHPVRELQTGRVTITAQNHEFQVDDGPALAEAGFQVSHINLNDGSIEGLMHREKPIFSVQYHPEGCPGPQDNQELFDRFVSLVRRDNS
jgi:carbamoyl-phosphate synthase small subunit